MQNQQLSDVKGKELVAAGHALANAIGMDTPLIEIAKMMAALATRLDCALVRGDELQAQRDALAVENAALKESVDHAAGCIHAAEVEGLQDALESRDGERLSDLVHRRLCHAYLPAQSQATDAYLNSVRAEGADLVGNALAKIPMREMPISGQRHHYIQRSEAILTAEDIAAQLRAGKDGE